jgi:phosphoribosylformylglycinamidine synthase PurS subunit
VRVGKFVELTVEAGDREAALAQVADMAERFLTNPVIESYRVVEAREIEPAPEPA